MDSRAICITLFFSGCYTINEFVRADTKYEVLSVTLYTDLVDVIGANTTCKDDTTSANDTAHKTEQLRLKQGVVLSKYQFYKAGLVEPVIEMCEEVEVKVETLTPYDWTCFSTGSNESRDINWFMVDCTESESLTISCFEGTELIDVIKSICYTSSNITDSTGCKEITYGRTNKNAICSKYFHTEKKTRRVNLEVTGRSLMDITAYLCVTFILITFIITMLIPVEQCKPAYKYDREQCLRVPLKIYEMCGVEYKPSARKKITRTSLNPNSVSTINVDENNKSKDDVINDIGNDRESCQGNAINDINTEFGKALRRIKEHTNNVADTVKDTVVDNIENTDTNCIFKEEDSGHYDTIGLPHIELESTTNLKAYPEDGTSSDTSSDGLSINEFKEILQETVTSKNRRHQRALKRFSQNQFDTVVEEVDSAHSGLNENHDEGRRGSYKYIYNSECRDSNERNNGRHLSKERNVHFNFDDREVVESKRKSTGMKSFDKICSRDSSVLNSVTNIVYAYEIDDYKIKHHKSQSEKFKPSSRKSRDGFSKSRVKSRDQYDRQDDEDDSDYYYKCSRSQDEKSRNKGVCQKTEADVTGMQDSSNRPRISITVEFPQNFGPPSVNENKRKEPEKKTRMPSGGRKYLTPYDGKFDNSCKRDYMRSRSVDDTLKKHRKSAMERKFSMC